MTNENLFPLLVELHNEIADRAHKSAGLRTSLGPRALGILRQIRTTVAAPVPTKEIPNVDIPEAL